MNGKKEYKKFRELERANTEELVRRFENLNLDEQSAIASVMDTAIMENELAYRRANDKSALIGFMRLAEGYKGGNEVNAGTNNYGR